MRERDQHSPSDRPRIYRLAATLAVPLGAFADEFRCNAGRGASRSHRNLQPTRGTNCFFQTNVAPDAGAVFVRRPQNRELPPSGLFVNQNQLPVEQNRIPNFVPRSRRPAACDGDASE